MDKYKVMTVAAGYLRKDQKSTVLTSLFLCFVTIFLLVGNQLFLNVRTANRRNAEALEGKQHALYSDISEAAFQKLRDCELAADAGMHFHLGRAADGTCFDFIDESFRDLSADVAGENIKQVTGGRWADGKQEVVFTENYMERYGLTLGDTVSVDLTATDPDTGDVIRSIPGLVLTIVGTVQPETGFADRRTGYVSEELAASVIREMGGSVDAAVRFCNEEDIQGSIDRLNAYLGYEGEALETLQVRKNFLLADAVDSGGTLEKQNRLMNAAVWLICALVIWHIFSNRLWEKERDFTALRHMGFQKRDLLKIVGTEFLILVCIGFAAGILAGSLVNRAVYCEMMKTFTETYDAGSRVSPGLSWGSISDTGLLLLLILLPGAVLALRRPVAYGPDFTAFKPAFAAFRQVFTRRRKWFHPHSRKPARRMLPALMILSMSAILISMLGIQDNHSDEGILSVKEYVPGDLQLTAGSIFESMSRPDTDIPSISDQIMQEIKRLPGIRQVQGYAFSYDRGIFLCEEKQDLNADAGYYEMLSETEQMIDGKPQCLYNVILAASDDMKALIPSYDEKTDGHAAVMEGTLAETLNLQIGDAFTLYDEELISTGSKSRCRQARVKLLSTQNIMLSESHVGGNIIIVDKETARLFPGRLYRQVVNVWTEDGEEAAVSSRLERLADSSGYMFHSAARQMQKLLDSDRNQRILHGFFLIILVSIGLIIYFNTVFSSLLSRRNEFLIMHKIGIRRKEMYGMVMREGLRQGCPALAAVGIAQLALRIGRQESFFITFAVTDAGMMAACVLFPVIILHHMCKQIRTAAVSVYSFIDRK